MFGGMGACDWILSSRERGTQLENGTTWVGGEGEQMDGLRGRGSSEGVGITGTGRTVEPGS